MTSHPTEPDRLDGTLAARDQRIRELEREVKRLAEVLEAEQKAAEALRLALGQHIHRSKNMLAIMQSISHRTICEGRSAGDTRDALTGRLRSLSRAYHLLVVAEGRGAEVGDVIETQLIEVSDRVTAAGPPARLAASGVLTFALAIHELASNAMKHGALRAQGGGVAVGWTYFELGADRYLEVAWSERGGVPPRAPSQYGFGLTLVSSFAEPGGARPNVAFDSEGLNCRLRLSQDVLMAV
ncbi:MAG: HWE histidine kinase domain-containing protein [Hyphomicrobium sp.]|uniref:HWE histidine kinase domain-containing protein n=1 Tax=Hyphomicrobium sp. TaxID=82 RepID=UPI003D141842